MNGELYPGEFEAMERQGRLDAVIPEQKMMTREEAIEELSILLNKYQDGPFGDAIDMAMTALEQEPFINKPCVSNGICEHDKQNVLDMIRAEIEAIAINGQVDEHTAFIRTGEQVKQVALEIIDKHKAESE